MRAIRAEGIGEPAARAVVLAGAAALMAIGVTPAAGVHLPDVAPLGLAMREHLGPLCMAALHLLLLPLHYGLHALVSAGVAFALYDRGRAVARLRRALAPLDARTPAAGEPLHRAAVEAGLDPRRVRVVDGLPAPAFTVGWLRPTVYVAAALPRALAADEVAAVLAHERAHCRRRDPLRLSLMRFAARALFWLPALRRLADAFADEVELRADALAGRHRRAALARALVTLAAWPAAPSMAEPAVGIHRGAALLERRVRRLTGESLAPAARSSRGAALGVIALVALFWSSGAVLAHPLPSEGHGEHCRHPGEPALAHLFCQLDVLIGKHARCPHALHAHG
jgi:Zn-dependent protease with chaperone function